ncbi:MAG: hypothetical protein ABIO43_04140, partial [Sphingomicrobium sp.]
RKIDLPAAKRRQHRVALRGGVTAPGQWLGPQDRLKERIDVEAVGDGRSLAGPLKADFQVIGSTTRNPKKWPGA